MGIENHVSLTGNLGDDPETKYTQSGVAVTKARVATTSKRKNRDGESVEETQWHRVTFFGKLAEIAGEYLRKGATIQVMGSIRYSESTGQDGQKRYYTEIVADQMKMLGGRRDGDAGQRPARQNGGQRAAPPAAAAGFDDGFADDDIPF